MSLMMNLRNNFTDEVKKARIFKFEYLTLGQEHIFMDAHIQIHITVHVTNNNRDRTAISYSDDHI